MGVQPNWKVASHGILCPSIQIWFEVAKCYGIFFEITMAKDPMMGQELWSKDFFEENNLMPKVECCKMLKRLLHFYANVYLNALSHHILVLWNCPHNIGM
jgi:hypothetical protein